MGQDETGKDDPNCLTVVDSGGGSSPTEWKKHTVRLVEVTDKKLPGKWQLVGEVTRKNITLILLENVVGLRLEKP